MIIRFYNPNAGIEPWTWTAAEQGIGGSEISAIEMSLRLAARGHDVTCYTRAPETPFDPERGGVHWRDLSEADLSEDGLWVIYRSPSTGLQCKPAPGRRYFLVCQDVYYADWTPEAVAAFDRIFALCPDHQAYIEERDPTVKGRIVLSSNGVNVEAIEAVEAEGIPRNPKRIIWLSSPDRGLKEVLDIFERARELVPDLELSIFYGMNAIDSICGGDRTRYPWVKSWQQYYRANSMSGVTWHGRTGQTDLKRELLGSGIWLYPTWFSETSCIACMEAQACGAIPITRPFWAVGWNVRHGGVFVEGDPNEPLIKARYVAALVAIASDPDGQEAIRARMMPRARVDFDWDRWAEQWELLGLVDMGEVERMGLEATAEVPA